MGNSSSKGEPIDERCLQPWGLYPELIWDKPTQKAVKKLILDRKLAPFFPPAEAQRSAEDEECPICFMYYRGGLNHPRCCKGQRLCTECYLQVSGPDKDVPTCPFCNKVGLVVVFEGAITEEQLRELQEEEQKVIQLQIRVREDEIKRDQERETERARRRAEGLPDLGPMTLDANGEIVAAPPPAPAPAPAPPPVAPPSRDAEPDSDDDEGLAELLESSRLGDLPPGAEGGRQWEIQQLEELMMSEAIARSMQIDAEAEAAAQAEEAEQAEATPTPAEMAAGSAASRAAASAGESLSLRADSDALTREIEQAMRGAALASSAGSGDASQAAAPEVMPPVGDGPDAELLAEAEMDEDLAMALRLSMMGAEDSSGGGGGSGSIDAPPTIAEGGAGSVGDHHDHAWVDGPVPMGTPPRLTPRDRSTGSHGSVKLEASPVGRLPTGWESAVSRRTGEVYFVNTVTGERTFEMPVGPRSSSRPGSGRTSAEASPVRSSARPVSPVRMAQAALAPASAAAPVPSPGSPASPPAADSSGQQWSPGPDPDSPGPDSPPAVVKLPSSDYAVDSNDYVVDSADYAVQAAASEPKPEPEQAPAVDAPVLAPPAEEAQSPSASNAAKIRQFVDICGADETTAGFTLASVGFDLERAIDRYLSAPEAAQALPQEDAAAPPPAELDDLNLSLADEPEPEPEVEPAATEAAAVETATEPALEPEVSAEAAPKVTAEEPAAAAPVEAAPEPEAPAVETPAQPAPEPETEISSTAAANQSLEAPPALAWGAPEPSAPAEAVEPESELEPAAQPVAVDVDEESTEVSAADEELDSDLALALELSRQLEQSSAAPEGSDSGGAEAAGVRVPPQKAWVD